VTGKSEDMFGRWNEDVIRILFFPRRCFYGLDLGVQMCGLVWGSKRAGPFFFLYQTPGFPNVVIACTGSR
jgi:hypothetical protein